MVNRTQKQIESNYYIIKVFAKIKDILMDGSYS